MKKILITFNRATAQGTMLNLIEETSILGKTATQRTSIYTPIDMEWEEYTEDRPLLLEGRNTNQAFAKAGLRLTESNGFSKLELAR